MFYVYADITSPGKGIHAYTTNPPEGDLLLRALLIVIVSLFYGVLHCVSRKFIYGNNSIHGYCAFSWYVYPTFPGIIYYTLHNKKHNKRQHNTYSMVDNATAYT